MVSGKKNIVIVGIPAEAGAGRPGCLMGPDALRTAGLRDALADLGHDVCDAGDVRPTPLAPVDIGVSADTGDTDTIRHSNGALKRLHETVGWIIAASQAADDHAGDGRFPVFMGGDHSISAGTVAGLARRARKDNRRQFVLWLDAHSDFHSLDTTRSGNLHGTPVAYFTGQPGFDNHYPLLEAAIEPHDILMAGIRSVDSEERDRLASSGMNIADMRRIDEMGIAATLRPFLERVAREEGRLHVSLDVDFLDPAIAPAVGTTVPGGATFREAHLAMELLHESGLVTSLDLAELNPFLDERGRTAKLMVDLAASLFGRTVLDRPTYSL